jgi:hypothetical protein
MQKASNDMTDSVDSALARQLAPAVPSSMKLSVRSAVVTAVAGHVATITLGGVPVPGVPVYFDVSPIAGSIVDVLFVGTSPRIIGVTG